MSLAPYAKAVTAFVSAAATTIAAAILPASDAGSSISATEWIGIALTAVVATAAVFAVPNKPATEGQ